MTDAPARSRNGVVTHAHAACADRVQWTIDHGQPGATTVFIAGMHGNEPAAGQALDRVHRQLADCQEKINGRVYAITGNLHACHTRQRFVDEDLNRLFRFTPGPQPHLELAADPLSSEYAEAVDLLAALQRAIDETPVGQPVNVIDLHTFSGDGAPFLVLSDTLRNRELARCLPIPMVLGLAELLQGTLVDYLTACGCVCAVVETGRHDDPRSAQLHEAAIRRVLVHAGHVADAAGCGFDPDQDEAQLEAAASDAPRVLDVQDRYGIAPGVLFKMRPGYANFDHVQRGEHLADANGRPVYASRSGRMLLPLYQQQGEDGFFIARPIGRIWLRISGVLRRMGISPLVSLLPGVKRHPTIRGALRVDRHIARWLAVDVFHLLGYRLVRESADDLVVARHTWDLVAPAEIRLDVPIRVAAAGEPTAPRQTAPSRAEE